MQHTVVGGVKGLVPEKIAVRPGVEEALEAFARQFSDRQRDCAVRPGGMDLGNDLRHPVLVKPAVLPALQDEGAESQTVSALAAGEDLLLCEAVADRVLIAPAYAAVEAVVSAVIGKFDQPAYIDIMSVVMDPDLTGAAEQIF